MSGGKGGSSTTTVEVPQYIEDAAKANLAKADLLAQIGYTPYYGPDVAAFTPMQQAAFQNTSDAASAFGMGGGGMTGMEGMPAPTTYAGGGMTGMEGMPAPTTYAGGVQGYSSAPMFEQSLAQLQENRPGQYDAINAPFISPVTGAAPVEPYTGSTAPVGTNLAQANAPGTASSLPTVTEHERRMGLTPEAKARGMTIADYMGR